MVLILFNVLISFAQFEREVTREQIRGTTLLIQNKFQKDKTLFSEIELYYIGYNFIYRQQYQ